jgi:hypothetical protein
VLVIEAVLTLTGEHLDRDIGNFLHLVSYCSWENKIQAYAESN